MQTIAPSTRPGHRRIRATSSALAALVVIVTSACDPPGSGDEATTGCAAIVAEASQAAEPAAQVRLLDKALASCGSYASFTGAIAQYPSMIGYSPERFVSVRCQRADDETVRAGAACSTVIAPVTTPPPTTIVDLVFVGDTLDGRRIEIRPSADLAFVGDVPAVVQQTVDIAFESGCEGVLAQRDLWAAQADDTPAGSIASVYAQHAQNVANYIQCDAPTTTQPAG